LSDYSTTGDGLLAALQLLAVIVREQKPASEVCRVFQPMPQLLRSVGINGRDPLGDGAVKKAIQDGEGRLAESGRLLIRKSGTEPLIRVMAEGEDAGLIGSVVDNIVGEIERAGGSA
jgi:phosphoglucosamine mutase